MADKKQDVKEEEKDTPTDESTEEKPLEETEETGDKPVKTELDEASETEEATEDEVLADGTKKSEKTVPYNRFEERNKKATEAEEYSDIIEAVKAKPELREQLLKGEVDVSDNELSGRIKEVLDSRYSSLEEEVRKIKERETAEVLRQAMAKYSDFRKNWSKIKTLIPVFEQSGQNYAEAVENAYYLSKKETVSQDSETPTGATSSSSADKSTEQTDEFTPEQLEALKVAGISVERAKELKEKGTLDQVGF